MFKPKPGFIFFFLFFWSLTSFAQERAYTEQQKALQEQERLIEEYIQNHLSTPLPPEIELQIHDIPEDHEHGDHHRLSPEERQDTEEHLIWEYWRNQYFDEFPEAAIAYRALVSSDCNNGNFESGNFTGYSSGYLLGHINGYLGGECSFIPTTTFNLNHETPGANVDHVAIVTNGTDPLVPIDRVNPLLGGANNFAARINNGKPFAGPSWVCAPRFGLNRLSREIILPADDAKIGFYYALVMENPFGHVDKQPFFVARALHNGQEVDRICQVAAAGDPFFLSAPDTVVGPCNINNMIYSDWTCGELEVGGQAGDTIILDFYISDCGAGGHFGYGYIDDICEACVSDSCNDQGSIDLVQSDSCFIDSTVVICGTFEMATLNCIEGTIASLTLEVIQNGDTTLTTAIPVIDTANGTFCFTLDSNDFPFQSGGYDIQVTITFNVGGGTHTEMDVHVYPGLENDVNFNGCEPCQQGYIEHWVEDCIHYYFTLEGVDFRGPVEYTWWVNGDAYGNTEVFYWDVLPNSLQDTICLVYKGALAGNSQDTCIDTLCMLVQNTNYNHYVCTKDLVLTCGDDIDLDTVSFPCLPCDTITNPIVSPWVINYFDTLGNSLITNIQTGGQNYQQEVRDSTGCIRCLRKVLLNVQHVPFDTCYDTIINACETINLDFYSPNCPDCEEPGLTPGDWMDESFQPVSSIVTSSGVYQKFSYNDDGCLACVIHLYVETSGNPPPPITCGGSITIACNTCIPLDPFPYNCPGCSDPGLVSGPWTDPMGNPMGVNFVCFPGDIVGTYKQNRYDPNTGCLVCVREVDLDYSTTGYSIDLNLYPNCPCSTYTYNQILGMYNSLVPFQCLQSGGTFRVGPPPAGLNVVLPFPPQFVSPGGTVTICTGSDYTIGPVNDPCCRATLSPVCILMKQDAGNEIEVENAAELEMLITPNPAKNEFWVKFTTDIPLGARIQVFSPDGKLVEERVPLNQVKDQKLQFSANEWADGIYLIQLVTNDEILASQKLVLTK